MGTESIVSGYIRGNAGKHGDAADVKNRRAIAEFPFDEKYPFTNIFWCDSPARYGNTPIIGFAGCFKQIEESWNEWLWKFAQLLSQLEAIEARVNLDCIIGSYYWRLQPRSWLIYLQGRGCAPATLQGEQWGIVQASPNDFTLTRSDDAGSYWNPDTRRYDRVQWTQRVERWQ
jgi:hypothetical protein